MAECLVGGKMGPPNEHPEWLEMETILRRTESLIAASQFTASIMHEIRNPLESASNLAYLIREEASDAVAVRRHVILLEEQLGTVTEIARKTLNFYQSSETLSATDLVHVAQSALRVHEHKITAKQLDVRTALPEKAVVQANPGEMLQLLSNLVGNAVDALSHNGILRISVRQGPAEMCITVMDNGHGIPEALRTKVFDPFFTTKQELGTGLGLAISKSIIDRHHGRIKTRSSTRGGRTGTAFRITLPVGLTPAVAENDHTAAA